MLLLGLVWDLSKYHDVSFCSASYKHLFFLSSLHLYITKCFFYLPSVRLTVQARQKDNDNNAEPMGDVTDDGTFGVPTSLLAGG